MSKSKYKLDKRDLDEILSACKLHKLEQHNKIVRKVLRLANSLIIVLPEFYVKSLGLKHGDEVEIYFDDYLCIKPRRKRGKVNT